MSLTLHRSRLLRDIFNPCRRVLDMSKESLSKETKQTLLGHLYDLSDTCCTIVIRVSDTDPMSVKAKKIIISFGYLYEFSDKCRTCVIRVSTLTCVRYRDMPNLRAVRTSY